MPTFSLFRKKKKEVQQEQVQQTPAIEQATAEEQPPVISKELTPTTAETIPVAPSGIRAKEQKTEQTITYLKAMPLHELADLETVKNEVKNGNIIILRITPLANKSMEDVKQAVDQLYAFTESIHGDIARLGEERIVICSEKIRIWRETTTKKENSKEHQKEPSKNTALPSAA